LVPGTWYYKTSGGGFEECKNSNTTVTGASLSINTKDPAHMAWFNNDSAVFKVVGADAEDYFDLYTVTKLVDGADGDPACHIILSNEAITIPVDENGNLSVDQVYSISAAGFCGADNAIVNFDSYSCSPSGSASVKPTSNNSNIVGLQLTFLKSSTAQNGTINLTFSAPIVCTKTITWSKSK
jgi:hypothetical protein